MILVNWDQTINKEGKVIPMKKVLNFDVLDKSYNNNYGYVPSCTCPNCTKRKKEINQEKKNIPKTYKIEPNSCCVCGKEIKEGKKLIPYEIGAGRKYAHVFCWYKAIKRKKDVYESGFKKYNKSFMELNKQYPKELLIGQLQENES
jgi:hypothetical protein